MLNLKQMLSLSFLSLLKPWFYLPDSRCCSWRKRKAGNSRWWVSIPEQPAAGASTGERPGLSHADQHPSGWERYLSIPQPGSGTSASLSIPQPRSGTSASLSIPQHPSAREWCLSLAAAHGLAVIKTCSASQHPVIGTEISLSSGVA